MCAPNHRNVRLNGVDDDVEGDVVADDSARVGDPVRGTAKAADGDVADVLLAASVGARSRDVRVERDWTADPLDRQVTENLELRWVRADDLTAGEGDRRVAR